MRLRELRELHALHEQAMHIAKPSHSITPFYFNFVNVTDVTHVTVVTSTLSSIFFNRSAKGEDG